MPLTGIEEIPIVQDGETKKVNSSEFISEFNNDSITVSVSTSYDIDWNASGNWDLTLTGNTVINQSNTPVLNKEKTITIHVKGDFALILPAEWVIKTVVFTMVLMVLK